MLDKRCIALLKVINNECKDSAYKIFSISELSSNMPARLSLESEGLKEALSNLANHEYISVKYQDESEVCLRPLIKGRVAIENLTDNANMRSGLKKSLALISFFGAVLGGLLSSLMLYFLGVR